MTHTTRATELAGAGKTDEAIEELLAALELDPQYLPAHANLIQFYSNQNRFDKADRHFRAAVASGSPAPTARLHYARSLIKQQRLLEAVPVLEELLAINPGTESNHDGIGARVAVLRNPDKPLWRRARTDGSYMSANDIRVHFGLGEAETVDGVLVHWPSGRELWRDISVNRFVSLKEGSGEPLPPPADP